MPSYLESNMESRNIDLVEAWIFKDVLSRLTHLDSGPSRCVDHAAELPYDIATCSHMGNLVVFYIINWIVSAMPRSGMYTIMYRLFSHGSELRLYIRIWYLLCNPQIKPRLRSMYSRMSLSFDLGY
ncbi:aminophospholipid ATPase 2 [Artemisia annua]|uniref:Aminophospholipid ATPase 2 n=1 Tax=Artemisia annua TaxID=35608 RepID=A0A2U1QPA4_ARTAN|nr:aminophospholipid ATPase 2 [Artemisia annua]